ncbi:MAG: hypothetical protein EBZ61_11785 [Micrococcales bacterium]|nr:hypothetical protein [Micrococcales bacterium]
MRRGRDGDGGAGAAVGAGKRGLRRALAEVVTELGIEPVVQARQPDQVVTTAAGEVIPELDVAEVRGIDRIHAVVVGPRIAGVQLDADAWRDRQRTGDGLSRQRLLHLGAGHHGAVVDRLFVGG